MKKILLAPNSFKECANSVKIAELLENYLHDLFLCKTVKFPISDGGDGFLDVCKVLFEMKILTASVSTPYNDAKIDVKYGYCRTIKTIFIESANVLGITRIPPEERHPLALSSKGLGELVNLLVDSGLSVEKVIIGIGGTGTNDLGLGFCSQFGLQISGENGEMLEILPKNFNKINDIFWSRPGLTFKIEMVLDVENLLLGTDGATKTFAQQKGATKEEIDVLESGFTNVTNVLKNNGLVTSVKNLSGAGGGLAAGLEIFFGASKIRAEDFIINELTKNINISDFDYIITGEGAFDKQSLLKKGASIIIDYAMINHKRVFLICGKIEKGILDSYGDQVIPIELVSFFETPSDSIKNPEKGLKSAAEKIKGYLRA